MLPSVMPQLHEVRAVDRPACGWSAALTPHSYLRYRPSPSSWTIVLPWGSDLNSPCVSCTAWRQQHHALERGPLLWLVSPFVFSSWAIHKTLTRSRLTEAHITFLGAIADGLQTVGCGLSHSGVMACEGTSIHLPCSDEAETKPQKTSAPLVTMQALPPMSDIHQDDPACDAG